jgi:hypothetical protein
MAASGRPAATLVLSWGEALMPTGPGDERAGAAGGRGHLRASHADREQVIALLTVAFVQGRLTKVELDARVGQTFGVRTYAELAELTSDLPAGLTAGPSPRRAARVRARPARARTPAAGEQDTDLGRKRDHYAGHAGARRRGRSSHR